jgi:hypothetical protein
MADHALLRFPTGGLLLDLEAGALFQLNASATFVWDRWLAGVPEAEIAAALVAAHALPMATATAHVTTALAKGPRVPPPTTEYHYERSANRYIFSREGTAILAVEERGEYLELLGPAAMPLGDIRSVLLSISPKLLALRGHFVLHASAVVIGSAVLAFSGESGAGKTTTARAVARAGATPICEDKLVGRMAQDRIEVLPGVEQAVYRWVHAAAERLSSGARAECPSLPAAPDAEPIYLNEIGFIDAQRRGEGTIRAIAQSQLETTGAIFRNSFYGSDVGADWRRQLEMAAELARVVSGYALTMPEGLPALDDSANELVRRGSLAQMAMTAS